MTSKWGVTDSGFVAPTGEDVYNALIESFEQQFGSIDVTPQSITGQFISIFSQAILSLWQAAQGCYSASYPATAQGVSLDGIAQLVGITRKPATRTTTYVSCFGLQGTVIPAGSLVGSSSNIFFTSASISISSSRVSQAYVSVPSLPSSTIYSVTINSVVCSYYWDLITFSAPLITGNTCSVVVGGASLGSVPFDTDSQTTLDNICTLINNSVPQLAIATAPTDTTIVLQPTTTTYTNPSIVVTGGASQPTVTYGYATPDTQSTIVSGLVNQINASVSSVATSSIYAAGTILIQALFFGSPISLSVASPLAISSLGSPVLVLAQTAGAIPASEGTITTIVSPIYGWQAVDNPLPPTIGSNTETDAELRTRIFSAGSSSSYATVSAITARLLGVSGVTYVDVIENATLNQLQSTITFSSSFSSGNTISISLNGSTAVAQLFTTDQATTMSGIISQLLQYPSVSGATYSGNTITISWIAVGTTTITAAAVTGGTSPPSTTWDDGTPPLSIECVVVGGSQQDIANEIYASKAAGVQTYGNVSTPVTTPSNGTTTIYYSSVQPIYIWVQCVVTSGSGYAGASAVQQAIYDYGITLGVGDDVYLYQVASAPSSVAGVISVSVQLSFTQSISDTPVFSASDVSITTAQISNWSLDRIFVS